ncbi:peptidylprolyl isomerase [Corynebacterium sp. H130]|uniref:peptidylprolyl isomerase n=1 Tax=Corynebacterium sp. H130 TaxID=3133444 RepID=UPI003097951C
MKILAYTCALATTALLLTGCGKDAPEQSASACEYPDRKPVSKEVKKPSGEAPKGTVKLKLATTAGDIKLDLDADKAPCTVGAITHLAKQGYYDNTVCHRVTTKGIYVLQCGDPTGVGSGGPGFSFADEYPVGSGEKPLYKAGTIAMANAGPNTNGSQFFLNYEDSPLPPNYTLFGTMDNDSLQVIKAIGKKGTATGSPDGPPKEEVKITKAEVQ